MEPMAKPAYRADIDGLRALAVLPVVLYHAGVPGFSGGYVGVDIFFVISGFLITGIIAREVDEGHFSIWHFYERRARRILPALFVLVAAVLVAASFIFLPGDFEGVPRSALAALGFVANIWFFSQSGYFQGAAETMPLLHTWSLGVEEQFYIVFPLALILIAKFASSWRTGLVWVLVAASLLLALATADNGDGFAFYLLPARAWELLAGSLLALGAVRAVEGRALREVSSWAGIGMIAYAVFTYDKATTFPGLAAVPPVLGAALLIYCAPGTSAGRVLSWKPAVWIGLLSYSLYLWHWPLIVFAEYWQDAPLGYAQSAAVIATSVFAAWISLRCAETPFRNRTRYSRSAIFKASGLGMAVLGAACLFMISLGGWTSRFAPEVEKYSAAANDVSPLRAECLRTSYAPPDPACTLGSEAVADALLWGDSHGAEFAWVLGERAAASGRSIEQRTLGSCAPVAAIDTPASSNCAIFNAEVLGEIARRPELETIYLAGFWANGAYDKRASQLAATIAHLQNMGRRVVLIGAVPPQPRSVPRALSRAAAFGGDLPETTSLAEYEAKAGWITRRFDGWRESGVTIIDPATVLFDGPSSRITSEDKLLYFDSHHLTLAGARLVLDAHAPQ